MTKRQNLMENENEIIDSTTDTETTENTEELDLDLSDESEIDVEALKKENATLKAQKEHWKKKAETKDSVKTEKPEVKSENKKDLSTKDTLALIDAKISSDDFDEVVDFANYRKISIADALKSTTLKAILSERVEQRQTAEATQSKSPRTSPKLTNETLIERARQGQLPEKEEDISKLAEARMARKMGN